MGEPHEIQIIIDDIPYTYKEIINSHTFDVTKNKFVNNLLSFCKSWLTKQECFVSTTSGSTGNPKPITITRGQMEKSAKAIGKEVNFKNGYTTLVCLDSQFIAGQMTVVRSFVFGMNIYAVTPSSNPFEKIPGDISIDIASFVPYQLSSILNSKNKNQLNNLKCILVGGAPINSWIRKKIITLSCRVYATYGMTETLGGITLQKLNGADAQPYFKTIPHVHLSQHTNGCLIIEADFLNDKIITHDIIKMIKPNHFQWLGRKDNIINSGGVKIIPERIEEKIQILFDSFQIFNNFFIAGFPDNLLGNKVCLIIEGEEFCESIYTALTKELKLSLPPYSFPKEIKFIPQFIKTKTRKINRRKTILQINQMQKKSIP